MNNDEIIFSCGVLGCFVIFIVLVTFFIKKKLYKKRSQNSTNNPIYMSYEDVASPKKVNPSDDQDFYYSENLDLNIYGPDHKVYSKIDEDGENPYSEICREKILFSKY